MPMPMLPQVYAELYQVFRRSLQDLQHQVTQANPDKTALQSGFLMIQQQFQTQILSLTTNITDNLLEQRLQSIHTEINKQLRLLAIDISFLQAARQSVTLQQRQAQIRDRLTTLVGYCDVILQAVEE